MIDENQNNESMNKTLNNNNISNIHLSKIENDILFQLNQFKIDIENKIKEEKNSNQKIINQLITQFSDLESINKNLIDSLAKINVKLDQYNEFESFKKKAESQLITHEIRINNTMSDLKESQYKYDKIFIDNLSVPGFIGPQTQYKTIGEYLYNNIQYISSLNTIKDQMRKDIKEVKIRVENMNKEILTIVNSAEQRSKIYCDNKCKLVENNYELENKILNEKMIEVRLSNVKESIILEKKTKELEEECNNILNIKKEIEKKLIENLNIYKTNEIKAINKYNEAQNNFDKAKKKFDELIDFFKYFKSKNKLKKREVDKMINKLNDLNKRCFSDSDDSNSIDLDYNYKKRKYLKNDITSDGEEEYEKKKTVRKLFRKITRNHLINDINDENNLKDNISQNSNNSSMKSIINNENNNNKIEERKRKNGKLIKKSSITSPDKYNKKLIEKRKSVDVNKKFYDMINSNFLNRSESERTKLNLIKIKNNVKFKLNNQINNKKNIFSENEKEEYEMESVDLENKGVTLVKVKKSHKSCDSVKKISSHISRRNLKEKNKSSILNLKKRFGEKIDKNNFSYSNIYNQNKLFSKTKEKNDFLLKRIILEKEKEKSQRKNNTIDSINKINLNENDKIIMKQYLKNPIKNKNNMIEHLKHNSFNALSPKLNQNTFINDVNKEYNNLENKNQNLNNIRPKDYDPDFNFNLIELKIDNKYSPPLLFNNNFVKYEQNGRYNNKFNLNNSPNINNFSKTYLNNFYKDFIDCYSSKITPKKNVNFNDVLPLSQRNKIKFIKIDKKNYKEE